MKNSDAETRASDAAGIPTRRSGAARELGASEPAAPPTPTLADAEPDGDASDWLERVARRTGPLRLLRTRGAAGAYLASRVFANDPHPVLWIAPDLAAAERARSDLRTLLAPEATTSAATDRAAPRSGGRAAATRAGAGIEVHVFPPYDVPPYDRFAPHPEIEARRMSLLYRLLAAEPEHPLVLVAPWSALLRRVLPREELRSRVNHLERGMRIDRDGLLRILVAAGYHRTALVEDRGEVASRGGIIDLFPPQMDRPVRLELDFDELHSLRLFDPATQRSSEELDHVIAIPPRAVRIGDDRNALARAARELGRAQGLPESSIYQVTEPLGHGRLPPCVENVEPLFHEGMETLFDYLPDDTTIFVDDPEAAAAARAAAMQEIAQGQADARAHDRMAAPVLDLFASDDSIAAAARARRPIWLDPIGAQGPSSDEEVVAIRTSDHRELRREIAAAQGSGRALDPLCERLEQWKAAGHHVRLVCPSLSAAERLADILGEYGYPVPVRSTSDDPDAPTEPGLGAIEIAALSAGFELPAERLVVLTEPDIFGARIRRRPLRKLPGGQAIERLAQIQEGDFLVHAEHGIGCYGGLTQLDLGGFKQEFLLVVYDKGDKLYMPVSRLAQIQRYSGADDKTPRLDRMGGPGWARTKKRVKRAIIDMAEDLLAVVAAREVLEGHPYPAPDADYEEFEARFPYDDTPDQRQATIDVLGDLQSPRPMDRLVCGDVGFGKTEIACRAAYQVIAGGRQVAFLVPTTVLCQQHAKTLRERFADTPVEIGALSRFERPEDVRATREGLASGRVDIVVGTHRLLSKDVQFRNLGLIIVDEEHRFGVAHKERLKQMRKLVDVLTLSATPIPRTLQMALTGMRELSVIATPPPDRTAIRSQVCRFSDEVVEEAITRELRRGGQVFFVHNRVETIAEFTGYVRSIVPHARVELAHGQMSGAALEKIMMRFVERDFDVLVCTAIIESGLDIPNANTILIHRADMFGLAQLYQLRGRVGRSDRRAHAYFLVPPEGMMSTDARRRIEAVQDLSELGAGFRLATEDLEIRGAGNLLGAEQSGQIASVGYDLYMEMLEEAVAELRGQPLEPSVEPEIQLPIPALLPDTYVEEVNQRLVFYKQLSSARDDDEVRAILDDLLDRYGPLPTEALNLADVIRLKIRCKELGIEAIEVRGSDLVLKATPKSKLDPERLLSLIRQPRSIYRVTPDHRIHLRLREPGDALAESRSLLDLLGA